MLVLFRYELGEKEVLGMKREPEKKKSLRCTALKHPNSKSLFLLSAVKVCRDDVATS